MPGFVIHLAIAKKYIEKNKIKNEEQFNNGVIEPDLIKSNEYDTHFGFKTEKPNIEEFFKKYSEDSDYNKGYLLHLITDYLFYKKFLRNWSQEIYNDYDILNKRLVDKYKIIIPKSVENIVKYKDGETKILSYEDANKFIDSLEGIDLKKFIKKYIN